MGVIEAYLLNLVLVEIGNTVNDDPGQRSAKVHGLVHDERHDSGSQDVVAHPSVPSEPHLLKVVELDVVL